MSDRGNYVEFCESELNYVRTLSGDCLCSAFPVFPQETGSDKTSLLSGGFTRTRGADRESANCVINAFCSGWLMQWVACVAGAAWDDVGGYISQLCLESGTQRENMHTHEPPLHIDIISHTHTDMLFLHSATRWMCLEMHDDYSSGASGVPHWHGNPSLNTTNHRQGSMLIKTKAYSVADGTSHQIVFTRKLLELLPISNDWW